MAAPRRGALPWRAVVVAAVAGTAFAVSLVLIHVSLTGESPLNLIQAGAKGPSAAVIERDFPSAPLPDGIGHDGQQFYAIARQPMHWVSVAADLDRAPYRLQRPLLPWLAWLLDPSGGGPGLVLALFAVGVAALLAGAVALGAIAAHVGRSPWLGALFPVLPGSLVALRITTADALATALAVAAVAFLLRSRNGLAIFAAVLAVLAKETSLLIVVGYALWRRDKWSAAAAATAAGAAAALMASLRLAFPHAGHQVLEFGLPFVGLAHAAGRWVHGDDKLALATLLVTVALGITALARGGLRNPFGWATAIQLALLPVLQLNVIGLDLNATRTVLPLAVCAVLALASASPPPVPLSHPGP